VFPDLIFNHLRDITEEVRKIWNLQGVNHILTSLRDETRPVSFALISASWKVIIK